ncbi:hypothetical protein CcCBS67573_g07217 [Chytriomyces confervae]|uniref:Velvet domain-containing protein n=1 Tax=Chytriomyces confervae TaxID=246404 RepID=A0A507EY58_9FUNG|nr:hypothetical protein CcCBS67573_g07217 [Chytriomyces confervae]
MCGFASADNLKLTGGDAGSTNLYILSVSLWSENLTKDVSVTEKYFSGASLKYTANTASSSSQRHYKVEFTEGYDSCRVLWGGLAATCTRLKDLDGVFGSFFVFHDLSVRSSGVYRLKFDLFVMNITGAKMTPIASTCSDVFTVYTPKSFPGILETTALSRCFAKQGVSVRQRQTGENTID